MSSNPCAFMDYGDRDH